MPRSVALEHFYDGDSGGGLGLVAPRLKYSGIMISNNYTCKALSSVAAKAASFTASAKVGCA